jgi:hypothetical protein
MRRASSLLRRAPWCALAFVLAGCELTEVVLTTPEDIVVAELVLRAGDPVQRAYLHRTGGTGGSARVYGAAIAVRDAERDTTYRFEVAADSLCVDVNRPQPPGSLGTCYSAAVGAAGIRPGALYTLRIEAQGRVMTGSTRVPGALALVRPAHPVCELPPDTPLTLEWGQVSGAWVYLAEARMTGLREALRSRGVAVTGRGTVELTGLSIGSADTTLAFPAEFGVFERFDSDLYPILVAIADGLPPVVTSNITLAAGDRNYVNWVRGGNFNPSGQIRTPSVQGQGTGVFGSLVPRQLRIVTGTQTGFPACTR